MTRYALRSQQCPDLLTYGGRIICHHDRAQMEWLHLGATVVEIPADVPDGQCLPIIAHPGYADIQFDPITGDIAGREQFRDAN